MSGGRAPARWAGVPITLLVSNVRAVLGTVLGVTHRGYPLGYICGIADFVFLRF